MRSLKPYLWAISKILNWVFTRIVALIFGIFPVNSLLFLYGSDNFWDFLHHKKPKTIVFGLLCYLGSIISPVDGFI